MIDLDFTSVTKLGVFDSGLGGLTVMKELLLTHPAKEYIYFGDTAHVPYGSRDAEDVIGLVTDIARYLVGEGCQGLVLACNTSSALALSALRATVDVPILGVIEAASSAAAKVTRGRVAVLANPLTANSGVYGIKIQNASRLLGQENLPQVSEIGCPELVGIVENETLKTSESRQVLESYAKRILDFGADTLVLGCTHYPLLLPVLRPLLPEDVEIVNPAQLISDCLGVSTSKGSAGVTYKVSGDPKTFNASAAKILGTPVHSHQITLARTLHLT